MGYGLDRNGNKIWIDDQADPLAGISSTTRWMGKTTKKSPTVAGSVGGGSGLQTAPTAPSGPSTALPPAYNPFDQTKPGIGETIGGKAANQLMSGPGATEQQWGATQGQWNSPTAVEGYWQGVQGKYNGGGPMVSNRADDAYSAYMRTMPTINPEANIDSYYDNARTRFRQETDRALGARGAFNSSAALDKIGQGMATLNAQQAKDEAQYGLDRASTLGNLWSIGGTMARGADESSLARAESQRSWVDTLGGLATNASRTELDRLAGGIGAASKADSARVDRLSAAATAALGAQGARDSRIQTAFQNINKLGGQLADVASSAYTSILAGDQALMDAALSGDVARVAEALNISRDEANQIMNGLTQFATAVTANKKGEKVP